MQDLPIFLQIRILIYIEFNIFRLICSTNKQLYSLFNGKLSSEHGNLIEYLYQEKSHHDLTDETIKLKEMDDILSWREFYFRFWKIKYATNKIVLHYISLNQWFVFNSISMFQEYPQKGNILEMDVIRKQLDIIPSNKNLKIYFMTNDNIDHKIKVLQWLRVNNIHLTSETEFFISRNEFKIVEWMLQNYLSQNFNGISFSRFVYNNDFNILNLFKKYNILPNSSHYEYATTIEMLQWFDDNKISLKSYSQPNCFSLSMLKYLKSKNRTIQGYFISNFIQRTKLSNSDILDILNWCKENNIQLTPGEYFHVSKEIYLWLQKDGYIAARQNSYYAINQNQY